MVKGEVHRKHLVERTSSPFASSVLSCAKEKEKKKIQHYHINWDWGEHQVPGFCLPCNKIILQLT